jgi:hypothetical protein
LFANAKGINRPWDKDEMCAGKDWLSGFMKRNGGTALRKPEGLSTARTTGAEL